MEEIADGRGARISQIAPGWLLHREEVILVIIGAKKMSQLEDNLGTAEIELTDGENTRILKVTEPLDIYPNWTVERMNGDRDSD